jgi:tetratricopeptide (TPR) repeat protein
MSKPTLVTLPCVLLLLDYWPFERWQKIDAPAKSRSQVIAHLLWEKAPFFLFSMIFGIMLIGQLQADNYMVSLQRFSFSDRIMNTIVSYVSYLGNTFRPVDLAIIYPYAHSFQLWQVIGAASVLLAISVAVVFLIKRTPFLAVGWFWYLGTLFPVSGLLQCSDQAMADRYTYFPFIGIAIMVAWGIPLLLQREDTRKKILFPAAITALAIMAFFTWQQCGYWKNNIDLFNHTLQVTKDNYVAHNNLAIALLAEGKIKEAIDNYNKSIRLKPDNAYAYNNRGIAYVELGQYQMAIEDYNKAIRLKPGNDEASEAYNNRGNVYTKLGKYQMAIEDFNKAIRLKPDYAYAYNDRGIVYGELNQYQRAIEDFNTAIGLKPDYAKAYNNRALVYFNQKNIFSGCSNARKACSLGNCKILEDAKGKELCR